MGTTLQDVKFGLRVLRNNPVFTAVAVISLALGIGANTAIFQLLDAVRLRSLPIKDPQELVEVKIDNSDSKSGQFNTSHPETTYPQWEQIRDHQQSFSGIFAWAETSFNLAQGGEVRNARGLFVTGDFFKVLGVNPMAGRLFVAADDRRGCGTRGAVISYPFWQREFAGAPNAIGKTVSLDGHPVEVIGITPPSFFGLEVGHYFDVAVPVCSEDVFNPENSRLNKRHAWWLDVMGRLKPGLSIQQATAQLEAMSPQWFQDTVPQIYQAKERENYQKFKLGAFPAGSGVSRLRTQYESSLFLLLGIAGLVLLIACANLANLMLARASAREREIAVRLALGASRIRLIRQLLAESLLLAFIGSILGAFLAQVLSRFLISFITRQGSSLYVDLGLDWRLLGFTAAMAVLTSILFGLTPALRATRTAPAVVLRSSGRGMTASRERLGLRRILVISQVALSLILLVSALLFVRSLQNILQVNAGFRQDGILVANLDFTSLRLAPDRRMSFGNDVLERVKTVPGVMSAASANIIPLSGSGWNEEAFIDGTEPVKRGVPMFNRVTPGFFKTIGTPFVAGRDFDDHDTVNSPAVAIVNETFVKNLLDGANPIGRRFRVQNSPGEPDSVYEIVGLVKDTKYYNLREDFRPTAFLASSQDKEPDQGLQIMIESNLPTENLTASIKQTIAAVNPQISLDFTVFKTQINDGLLQERLMATLSGFFGFLAVVLAVVGLYGVISYMVAQRRNEIGIRMALGASRLRIVKMILGDAGILLAIGLVLGTILSYISTKVLAHYAADFTKTMLYGLKPTDPATIGLAIAGLALVGVLASYIPARRAAGHDPMEALRYE
ncbi:MAG TPA: ABC transporter permease [Blastocatellia bacterium]|nr:ABC transporter permease [Blastocatellia bacterium]